VGTGAEHPAERLVKCQSEISLKAGMKKDRDGRKKLMW
jgi:hypothetical protein